MGWQLAAPAAAPSCLAGSLRLGTFGTCPEILHRTLCLSHDAAPDSAAAICPVEWADCCLICNLWSKATEACCTRCSATKFMVLPFHKLPPPAGYMVTVEVVSAAIGHSFNAEAVPARLLQMPAPSLVTNLSGLAVTARVTASNASSLPMTGDQQMDLIASIVRVSAQRCWSPNCCATGWNASKTHTHRTAGAVQNCSHRCSPSHASGVACAQLFAHQGGAVSPLLSVYVCDAVQPRQ